MGIRLLKPALLFALCTIACMASANEFNLNPEISVKLILLEKQRSGDSKRYSRVNYKVDEDVTDKNGNILIRKGTPAYGTVLSSRRSGMLGRRGILDISVDYTTAVDGQKVNLRANKARSGSGNKGLITAGALLVAWPLAFCKGSNVSIDAGTTFVAYVNDSLNVKTATEENSAIETTTEKNSDPVSQIITLKNGDRISGNVTGLNSGIYSIKTSLGSLKIAEKDISGIQNITEPEMSQKPGESQGRSELQKRLDALKTKKNQEKKL